MLYALIDKISRKWKAFRREPLGIQIGAGILVLLLVVSCLL